MNKQNVSIVAGSIIGATILNAIMLACGSTGSKQMDAAADVPADMPADPVSAAPAGTVVAFAGQSLPQGWLLCDGSAVSRNTYPVLFGIVGTTYGEGDMVTTFNVPDLRGRTTIGTGQGGGLTNRTLAMTGGEEKHTLTVAEMPAHAHDEKGTNRLDVATGGGIHVQDVDNETFAQFNTSTVGGGGSHNVMQPFMALQYIIKI
jgi:microcystin-dependent protein